MAKVTVDRCQVCDKAISVMFECRTCGKLVCMDCVGDGKPFTCRIYGEPNKEAVGPEAYAARVAAGCPPALAFIMTHVAEPGYAILESEEQIP